jgi:hypothetical protein
MIYFTVVFSLTALRQMLRGYSRDYYIDVNIYSDFAVDRYKVMQSKNFDHDFMD